MTERYSPLTCLNVKDTIYSQLFITYRKSNPASASWVKRLAIQAASKVWVSFMVQDKFIQLQFSS